MFDLRSVAAITFRSLRVRNYRLYFFGQVVSVTGTWMQSVALMWLVLQLTGSGVALGTTMALQFTPILFAGAWGGVLVDRLDKRRVLIVTQAAFMLPALALGALTATGQIRLWMVYALAFVLGLVRVLDNPARHSFVIEMVGSEEVSNAVSLNSTVMTSARVVGPSVAGVLIAAFGIAPAFFLNAISFLATVIALSAMDPAQLHREAPVGPAKGQLREGVRYAWSTPDLRVPLLMLGVIGTLAYNFHVVLPMMAKYAFGGGPGTFGLLQSMVGLGAAIGGLAIARRSVPTNRFMVTSALAFGAMQLVASAAPILPLEMAALAFMGAASISYMTSTNSTLQITCSPPMRGRIMALYSVLFVGSTPIGSPAVGYIGQHFGPRAALALGGVATIVAATGGLWSILRRRDHVVKMSPVSEADAIGELEPSPVTGA